MRWFSHYAASVFVLSVLLAPSVAQAQARPDQVLVVYNKDWREDLLDSQPGQDSYELAQYYVQRRTDPKTGLKPYLLGLSAGVEDSPLNQTILHENSDDNALGLVTADGKPLEQDPWPFSSRQGDIAAGLKLLTEVYDKPRFAVAFLHPRDFAEIQQGVFKVTWTPQNGKPISLLNSVLADQRNPAVLIIPKGKGHLLLVDLVAIGQQKGTLKMSVDTIAGEIFKLERALSLPEACQPTRQAVDPKAIDKSAIADLDMTHSSIASKPLGGYPVQQIIASGLVIGLHIDPQTAKRYRPEYACRVDQI